MWSYASAERLAALWVEIVSNGNGVVTGAITRPYGWIFFFNHREYVATGDRRKAYAGNTPFLIDRVNGNLRTCGTHRAIRHFIEEFEQTVPSVWMDFTPDLPPPEKRVEYPSTPPRGA